ncbi:UDP-glycosyltransferase 83A1 [Linum perenne]
MAKQPHVIVVPLPAQGHLSPLMKLAHNLTNFGINVTIINIETIHEKIIRAMPKEAEQSQMLGRVRLVGVPDGLLSELDRNDPVKQIDRQARVMPAKLRSLVDGINVDEMVVCMVADTSLAWAFSEARAIGIKTAAFSPVSAANLALVLHMPTLIDAGIIDENGFLINKESPILISEDIPAWKANELPWSCQPDELQSFFFQHYYTKLSLYSPLFGVIVNSFHELEPSAFQLFPNFLPIGPLVTDSQNSNLPGSFWRQDRTCLAWLDKHPPKSVVYVAFGSITVLTRHQFEELASGLEMTGRPFLWVVRTNFVEGSGLEFLDGFLKRVANRGKIVEWANQEEVLSHPSIACFLSHCGWNSVLDGLWSGIPFLCWPYFIDQFHNRESICEAWKVGLRLDAEDDATGLITSLEIASKVEQLLSDDDTIRGNAIRLRKLARESVNENGSSYHSFLSFIDNLCS